MKKIRIIFPVLIILFFLFETLSAKWISLSNENVRISVDYDTSRFILETTESNKNNPNKAVLFKKTPPTTMTTVNIDGLSYIFGGENGSYKKRAYISGKKILSEWAVKDVSIIQEVGITNGPSTKADDTMSISYKITNKSKKKLKIGLRILFDTVLGDKDPKTFFIPQIGQISNEIQLYKDNVPEYWYFIDNPDHPSFGAGGSLAGMGLTKPDKIVFASWDRLYESQWEVLIDSTKEYKKTGSSDYDSAVGLYFDPADVEREKGLNYTTLYGLYEMKILTEKEMILSAGVPAMVTSSAVPVNVYYTNASRLELDRLLLELEVPSGFTLLSNEPNFMEYDDIETNEATNFIWHLFTEAAVEGNFPVKVKATSWQNNISMTVEVQTNFTIKYVKAIEQTNTTNISVSQEGASSVSVVSQPETGEQTMLTNKTVLPFLTDQEKNLVRDINELDGLITDINLKYQTLLGIYYNIYSTNDQFINEIGTYIKSYDDQLRLQEILLSNQKTILRE